MITAEQFSQFAASRRTTRDFLPTPVAPEVIDAILTDAMTAPSWSNTRGYMVGIATGAKRDRISAELMRRWNLLAAGRAGGLWGKIKLVLGWDGLPISDYRIVRPYPKELRPRSARVGKELYGMLGIDRGNAKARDAQWGKNYEFFGAPVALFIFTHKGLDEYSVSDAGLFMQNLMLSAHARGLGTCAQGAVAIWAKPIRREFKVPKGYKLLTGIALGYPADSLVNTFQANRPEISEMKLESAIE